MDKLLAIVIISALIVLHGLFVAAEFAIVAAPRMALERRALAGHPTINHLVSQRNIDGPTPLRPR